MFICELEKQFLTNYELNVTLIKKLIIILCIDQTGVGKLMELAVDLGKKVRPEMHCGICGEHGGDPVSVEFCHKIGLDYVSCSPFRVPIARLAAAQTKIKEM